MQRWSAARAALAGAVLAGAASLSGCAGSGSTGETTTSTGPSTTTTTTMTTTTVPGRGGFAYGVTRLGAITRAAMTGRTWRAGCPVSLDSLRSVSLVYWGFDQRRHVGRLVVRGDAVPRVVAAFRALYAARFPIRRMIPVEAFGGSDEQSMSADNTSGFNCRKIPGTAAWSEHALGLAVDVNPLENPEVRDGVVDPPSAARYADRSLGLPGMISHGDAAWQAFAAVGWPWGGDWDSPKDYQHFSATGR